MLGWGAPAAAPRAPAAATGGETQERAVADLHAAARQAGAELHRPVRGDVEGEAEGGRAAAARRPQRLRRLPRKVLLGAGGVKHLHAGVGRGRHVRGALDGAKLHGAHRRRRRHLDRLRRLAVGTARQLLHDDDLPGKEEGGWGVVWAALGRAQAGGRRRGSVRAGDDRRRPTALHRTAACLARAPRRALSRWA